ncbi:MAG: hypothetical protein K5641_03760 [Lachnospiraceae bacterium]|nr:hypothetical protein [Lachnospiraceae bacterium]
MDKTDSKAMLRRYENDLYVSGVGILIMGGWTVLKLVMELFLKSKDYFQPKTAEEMAVVAVILAVTLVMVLLIVRIHFYIGMNAIRAAKGRAYKKSYFKWAVIMLILTLSGLLVYADILKDPNNIDTNLASMLVDLTTIYIFLIVIISTKRIKNLKTKMQE